MGIAALLFVANAGCFQHTGITHVLPVRKIHVISVFSQLWSTHDLKATSDCSHTLTMYIVMSYKIKVK